MRIAFASGKGGAGKTTVAASLAVVWPRPCLIVDADVEAPNLYLFLQPDLDAAQAVYLTVPELDVEKCTACGACADMCAYKAIAMLGGKPTIFADMCHGCGGCFEVCAPAALSRGQRELGSLQWGRWNLNPDREQALLMGKSRVGEAMSPPLLRALERAFASAACDAPRLRKSIQTPLCCSVPNTLTVSYQWIVRGVLYAGPPSVFKCQSALGTKF